MTSGELAAARLDEKRAPSPVDLEREVTGGRRASGVVEKVLKHSHDADEAMKAFEGREGEVVEIDEATNKRLLRIIDWNLMPIMCVVYGKSPREPQQLARSHYLTVKRQD